MNDSSLLPPVWLPIAQFDTLPNRQPVYAKVGNLDLVIVRYETDVSVLYGRCPHRGALLADGSIVGPNLICGLHGWDFRFDTGVSEYNNEEALPKFSTHIVDNQVSVNQAELEAYERRHPQPFRADEYLGAYADTHPEATEPYTGFIKHLAQHGLSVQGHHGAVDAMGVDRTTLPRWDDIQVLPAQLATKPLFDDETVDTSVLIGPRAKRPLRLEIPLFVADMSFGSLSREAKIALAKGAELSGTAVSSGEGGMLPDEQAANSRYFLELASAQFGFGWDKVALAQAFHFKGGQGAKTGTGGHLPGHKVSAEIAAVRGLLPGEDAISPATFKNLRTVQDFRAFANDVRDRTGGIPVGFKIAASHVEADIDFALEASADYIILDGRGGGTGAAPIILRDHINVPTIPALARARRHLDQLGIHDVSLIITGGLRVPSDFVKAMALGADAIAVSNSALQAIGCIGMRACHTNNCPVGIATQKDNLRARLKIEQSARQLHNFFQASTELMSVLARACGHRRLSDFSAHDLSTFSHDMHRLTGIAYAGIMP
jgi:methylamine---glutamate N-methyltransferase subunit C